MMVGVPAGGVATATAARRVAGAQSGPLTRLTGSPVGQIAGEGGEARDREQVNLALVPMLYPPCCLAELLSADLL
jgi:hypothetical protein